VLAAGAGARALEISREFKGPIELLITDIVMAGMSGPELAADSVLGNGNEEGIALAQKVREVLDESSARPSGLAIDRDG
jgi:hypothetical protein